MIGMIGIIKCRDHLKEGKLLEFASGSSEETKKARIILYERGTKMELCFHRFINEMVML